MMRRLIRCCLPFLGTPGDAPDAYTDLIEAFGPIRESLLLSNPLELESGRSGSSSTANLSTGADRAFSFARFAGSALKSILPLELRNRRS